MLEVELVVRNLLLPFTSELERWTVTVALKPRCNNSVRINFGGVRQGRPLSINASQPRASGQKHYYRER